MTAACVGTIGLFAFRVKGGVWQSTRSVTDTCACAVATAANLSFRVLRMTEPHRVRRRLLRMR